MDDYEQIISALVERLFTLPAEIIEILQKEFTEVFELLKGKLIEGENDD